MDESISIMDCSLIHLWKATLPNTVLFPSDLSEFISPDNQNEFPMSDISLTTDNEFEAGLFNTDLPTFTDKPR